MFTNSKRPCLLIGLFVVSLFGLIVAIAVATTHGKKLVNEASLKPVTNNETQPGLYRYLPEGAKISDKTKDIVLADLDGDGRQEEIIFFTLPQQYKTGIAVLKPTGADYTRLWEEEYEHSASFSSPTGVYDLNKSGRPQIIAYHTIGTSCPGALEIYELRNGKIERISGPWAVTGHCEAAEIRDLKGDKRREIITRIRSYEANPDVYSWNGNRYVKNNSQFPELYNDELASLIRDAYSTEALPTNARLSSSKRAVEIYLTQGRYAEAVALCNGVIRLIDDPKLTKPNSIITEKNTPEQLARIAATFEIEKAEGKAKIHQLLGDTYQAAGNSAQAQAEYRDEQELQLRANEMRSKLPPLKLVQAN